VRCRSFELVFITEETYQALYGHFACAGKGRSSFFGALALLAKDLCIVREYIIEAARKTSELHWRDQGDRITVSIARYGVVIDFTQSE
jgi:ribosomal protein L16/L10AE